MPSTAPRYLLIAVAAFLVQAASAASGQIAPPLLSPAASSAANAPAAPASPPAPIDDSQRLTGLITSLLRNNLPDQYEKADGWGRTTDVWDGVRVWWDGPQLKTKRRKKQVNHGTWKLYRIRLIEPEQRFAVRVENLRELPAGRAEFDLVIDAALAVFGRISQWQYGVQLISLSADAEAVVRLRVTCNLGLHLDPTQIPPDVLLDPLATQSDLQLVHFRLLRVSNVGGPLAKELGEEVDGVLRDELAQRRDKLTASLNRQIDKHRDQLRLSLQDLLKSPWGGLAAKNLPAP